MPTPKILPCGDSAVTIEFGDRIDPDINGMVLALDDIIRARAPAGLLETVPTYRSLTVQFDPVETDYEALIRLVNRVMHRPWQILPSTFFSHVPRRLALMMPFVFFPVRRQQSDPEILVEQGTIDQFLRVEFGADTQMIPPGNDHGLMRFSRRIALVEPLHGIRRDRRSRATERVADPR